MSKEEINKLVNLDQSDFEYREWLALKYCQDRVFLGQEPSGSYMQDFHSLYSAKERAYILKLIRVQEFANYWMNTFGKKAWREDMEGQSCSFESKR